MATVGQQLASPEAGWRRYDDIDSRLVSNDVYTTGSSAYGGGYYYLNVAGKYVSFKFYGTKLRVIAVLANVATNNGYPGGSFDVVVDGVTYPCTSLGALQYKTLVFEKTDLTKQTHEVKIINSVGGYYVWFDAIDIDSDGYLIHPKLTQRTKLADMEIGDCIPCRYTATTSGAAGYFSEFGTCIADEIPVTGTATPNGLFYLHKIDEGLLGADRVVQSSIPWDTLHAAKYIEGGSAPTVGNPVCYIGFNGNTTATLINEVNGSSIAVSVTGTPAIVAGVRGNALSFNGSSQYITCNAKIIPIGKKSIRFKIKVASIPTITRYVFGSVNNATTQYGTYGFVDSTGMLYVAIAQASSSSSLTYGCTYTNVCDNVWHDILFTWDGAAGTESTKMYLDSKLVSIKPASSIETQPPYANLALGCLPSSPTTGIIGSLDEFEVYNYVVDLPFNRTIRTFSGGNSYLGSDGLSKLTNQLLGAWPTNNECDTYMLKSTLGGKITPGDESIWNISKLYSHCKDTPIIGTWTDSGTTAVATTTKRMAFGYTTRGVWSPYNWIESSYAYPDSGFRPVFEYISHPKQTNLWY